MLLASESTTARAIARNSVPEDLLVAQGVPDRGTKQPVRMAARAS